MSTSLQGATTAQQTKWSSKKSTSDNVKNSQQASHNPSGVNVKSVRRPQAPTLSSGHGCQSPICSLLCDSIVRTEAAVFAAGHWAKPRATPAARLVGIELNPGPQPKRAKQAKAAKKKQSKPKKQLVQSHKPQKKQRSRRMGNATGMSMVNDGVNVGSVWKNTTTEKVTFPMAREKVFDLTSTGTSFQTLVQQFVNPGNSQLFPIFSQIAKNYEEYQVPHLKFYFRTEEYMASGSNVSAGLVALGTNFDPDAPNFATMTELENYEHSISGPPFSGFIDHDVIEERRKRGTARGGAGDLALKNYFVNYAPNQSAPSATPAKFYDVGNFQLACNGCQAGVIGELWVEYSFTLIRRLQQPGAVAGGVAHWSATTATTANNLGLAALQAGNTLAGLTMTGSTITFPANQPGTYFVSVTAAGATSASALGYASATGGVALDALLSANASRDQSGQTASAAGTTTVAAMENLVVTVTNAGGTLVLSASTIVGAGTVDVWIFALPSTVLTVDEREELEITELQSRVDAQDRKIERLMALLSGSSTPVEESKESDLPTDMEASIHVPKSVLQRMLLGK